MARRPSVVAVGGRGPCRGRCAGQPSWVSRIRCSPRCYAGHRAEDPSRSSRTAILALEPRFGWLTVVSGGMGVRGELDVIEADDRQVAGDVEPKLAGRAPGTPMAIASLIARTAVGRSPPDHAWRKPSRPPSDARRRELHGLVRQDGCRRLANALLLCGHPTGTDAPRVPDGRGIRAEARRQEVSVAEGEEVPPRRLGRQLRHRR